MLKIGIISETRKKVSPPPKKIQNLGRKLIYQEKIYIFLLVVYTYGFILEINIVLAFSDVADLLLL